MPIKPALRLNVKESLVQLEILKYCKRIGAWGGKVKVKGGMGKGGKFFFDPYTFVGFPDLCFFFRNTLLFIEVKRPVGGELSIEQKVFQQKCIESKTNYIVARSVGEVREYLELMFGEKIVEKIS